jgi:hypothetical protein
MSHGKERRRRADLDEHGVRLAYATDVLEEIFIFRA